MANAVCLKKYGESKVINWKKSFYEHVIDEQLYNYIQEMYFRVRERKLGGIRRNKETNVISCKGLSDREA